jgi:enoyl-CoA hydratase
MKTLLLNIENNIAHLFLNNPDKANAMTEDFWKEIKICMEELDQNPEVRVVVIKGNGKHFSSGIDLSMLLQLQSMMNSKEDTGKIREKLRRWILGLQDSFNAIEKCRKPVIACIQGACVGGAVDLITACDMRFCSEEAYFCVKEIDLAIVADVGTLQRLPKIVSQGIAREWIYTAKKVSSKEAEKAHLVNQVFENQEQMNEYVKLLAENIASKSPLAIRGTKEILNYSQEHSTQDSLNYVATWNAAMLFSQDIIEAGMASMQKRKPVFKD